MIEDIDAFKNAPVGKEFLLVEFKMYGAKCGLTCYPQCVALYLRKSSVALYLRCEDFGAFLQECEVEYDFTIEELSMTKNDSHNFTKIQG